ncbi:MAG: nickel pincer cofactor biosynthesis protein LarB [Actinomycetota bacterium]|nr:nickel pincer cofactor biosynthesis protein LarB [Actinomycetota bacterium]
MDDFQDKGISRKELTKKISELYFEDIGFAKVDHHRKLRRGFPEVIFGANKTKHQTIEIAKSILKYSNKLLITKADRDCYIDLKKDFPRLNYDDLSQCIYLVPEDHDNNLKDGIVIMCAGTSDIPIAEEACISAYMMENNIKKIFDVGVAGLHRLLNFKKEILEAKVIIAVAGMEGALPGIVSSISTCPVIGVPTSIGYGTGFKGVSSLLTMLNSCSPGLSVVNIDNGFGAGYIAGLINRQSTI